MNSSAKGSTFEREIATKLSLWYTDGANDRVFWRSASSGAMATTRSKVGKTTAGGYGDITAIDPIGAPLTNCCVLELKKGYNNLFDPLWLLDRLPGTKPTPLEEILIKLEAEAEGADYRFPILIFKRDRRETMVAMPGNFIGAYDRFFAEHCLSYRYPFEHIPGLRLGHIPSLHYNYKIVRLSEFMAEVNPEFFVYYDKLRQQHADMQRQAQQTEEQAQ